MEIAADREDINHVFIHPNNYNSVTLVQDDNMRVASFS